MADGAEEFGSVGGLAEGGGGDEAGVGGGDGVGEEEVVEFFEGGEGAELGGGGEGGGGGAAEDDGLFEVEEGEEAAGCGVGADDEEFEGVGAEVGGGEEVVGGGGWEICRHGFAFGGFFFPRWLHLYSAGRLYFKAERASTKRDVLGKLNSQL